MKTLWNSEPAAILALIQAGITLLVVFDLDLTNEQIAAILTFSALLFGIITRSQVHSPASVEAIRQSQANQEDE